MITPEIDFAEDKDFDQIKAFFLKALNEDSLAFTVTFDDFNTHTDWWWRSYLSPYLDTSTSKLIIAKNDEAILGSIGIIFDNKEKRKHIASVVWFYVDKDFRGIGIGTRLFEKLNEYMEQFPEIKKMSLMVTDTQIAAKEIYKKNGFIEVGTLPIELFWNNVYYDVCIMEKLV